MLATTLRFISAGVTLLWFVKPLSWLVGVRAGGRAGG
jgi:hypothetical protein